MVAANETSPEIKLAGRYCRRGTFATSVSLVVQKNVDNVIPLGRRLSRPRRDDEYSIFRMQPLVNNLYQGMSLDPLISLYYERARWYSPSLGVWVIQYPLQYINGTNTYQLVMGNPVDAVDPKGLGYAVVLGSLTGQISWVPGPSLVIQPPPAAAGV